MNNDIKKGLCALAAGGAVLFALKWLRSRMDGRKKHTSGDVPVYATGLAGVIAGETAICGIGKRGHDLLYRGYLIQDLAEHCIFEEVAHLLIYGHLPTKVELEDYQTRIANHRDLSKEMKDVLELIPAEAHPMDVLKIGCAMMGALKSSGDDMKDMCASHTATDVFDALMGAFPSMILYHYFFHRGVRLDTKGMEQDSVAMHFLRLLNSFDGDKPNPEHVKVMDVSLILYAEHGFAASTFNCRVTTSTLSDTYSAVVAAIGTLRGPLHGGANEAAMKLISSFDEQNAEDGILEMLKKKRLVMGFGHRIYKTGDPRNPIIKECSRLLSQSPEGKPELFRVSEIIEETMWREKKLYPNLDFYSASAYHQIGIPTKLFTPVFVVSRIAGWAAHIIEQRSNNKLFRPSELYTGPEIREFIELDRRT